LSGFAHTLVKLNRLLLALLVSSGEDGDGTLVFGELRSDLDLDFLHSMRPEFGREMDGGKLQRSSAHLLLVMVSFV
jgi:hypothetical protein